MKLSLRLITIANYVHKNDIVADIGSDHGLLAIHLLLEHQIKEIYITDFNQLPLKSAATNLAKYQIKHSFKLICSWGLKWITNEKINTCIIAGLGANLIIKILEDDKSNIERYIVQANNNAYKIRQWIQTNNYFIENEIIIYENKIYYEIIVINKQIGTKIANDNDIIFGPNLRKNKTPIFIKYYHQKIKYWEKILQKIKNNDHKKNLIMENILTIKKELEA